MGLLVFADRRPEIGPIVLDASLGETHSIGVTLSDEVIEDGSNVVDHAEVDPRPLVIQGVITNHPSNFPTLGSNTRHTDGWRRLLELAKAREPVTVITTLERYSNMVAVAISTNRVPGRSEALFVSITLREALFARVDDIFVDGDAMAEIAPAEDELGPQGFEPVNESTPFDSL